MASLGILNPTEPPSTLPEMVHDVGKKTGEGMVNKSNESSSLPPVVVQPGHSNGGHGNKSTHGNSEAANSQKDTVMFSFRNYILGTENSAGVAETEKSETKATQSLDKCPEIKPEKETAIDEQKETLTHTQLETATHSFTETPKDVAFTEQRDDLREEHVDSNAALGETDTLDCNTMIRKEGTEAITETVDIKKENYSDESNTNVCVVETGKKDDSVNDTSECSNLLRDEDALSEMWSETQTGANNHTEEDQESKTEKWRNSPSDKQAEQDKKAKKKEKKKQRKKKKMAETEQREKTVQPENDLISLINAGTHTDSTANVESASQTDTQTVICGEQPDNGFDYSRAESSPGGKPSSSPRLSSSHSRQDHFTDLACSPASNQALSQRPHQSDNHNHADAPCGINHSSDESPHATGGVIDNHNTPMTYVQTAVINPAASADKRSDAQTQEAIVTSEAVIPTEENRSPLSNSRTCVGESGVESALEEALVVVAALPLTTPTMPEVIESKGEGESVRRDSVERVATVAIAESEKAVGEKDLGAIEKCLSSAAGEKEGLLDSLPRLALICSQGKCSLAASAKEGQAASEESCSSKMPHNSAETEMKGQGEATVHSADTEISPAEEGDREKEPLRLEAYINTSPLGLLTGPDCQAHSAAGLEGAGEGGGVGGGEEVGEKGRLAREHSSFSQPEGSACGVSSAETETRPPIDVAESQLKSQSWSEPIATITESICTEKERLSHPCRQQHGAAISRLSTHPEHSSSNTNGEVRADLRQNLISEEALSLGNTCEESSVTETEKNYSQVFLSSISTQPLTTLQQIPVERQESNNQQVRPESSTTEARAAEGAAEFQVRAQTRSNRGSPAMSGVGVYVCDSSGRNRVHFADTVKQEGSSSVDLRNMMVPPLDCASLPPLTVHESLHHPVVEASYIFPDFLSLKKPEIPTTAAPTKDETAIPSSADLTKPQKDAQLDKEDTVTKDTKENINIDQAGKGNLETNTVDLQSVTEACSKQLPCPTEENQTGNEKRFDLSQKAGSAISEADRLTVEQVSAKVTKQVEAETGKGAENLRLSKEKESKGSVKPGQPQESPLVSDAEEKEGNQHPLSSCSVHPADDVTCKPLSDISTELPVGQLSTDLDPSSKPETVTMTCTASLQINPSDPACQPPIQLDQTLPCGLVISDPMKASERPKSTIHSADMTKDETVTSEVTASDQSIPVIERRASNPTFVLRPPGPMLSHLEFISDCDICLPEQTDKRSADGDGTKVSGEVDGNKNREMTQMSLAQDLEHGDVSVKADGTRTKLEDRNDAMENPAIKNVNNPFSQEQNLSPPTEPPGAVGVLAKYGSDNVISLSHTEPDAIGITPVICEASIKDDLINVSCPLSSDLPTNEAHDEIKQDNMKGNHKMEDQTSVLFEKENEQDEEATVNNQKETADSRKLQTGKTGTTPQQGNGPDKEAVEETGDMQPPHKHKVQKTESPIRDIKEEGERKSGIASKSQTETSSLSPDKPAGSSEDMLIAEVESGSEPQTVYDQSLRQTPTATLERSSDRDTAPDLSAALGQSQPTPDPNCFARQQEQQQQRLGSRHPAQELSGGCLEGGEKTNSQVRQTQALVPGVKGVAEEGDGSVGGLCQSGSRDDLTGDDSGGNERVIGLEKGEGGGAQAAPGIDGVYVPSHLASDLNESGRAAERNASADTGTVTTFSHVVETRQAMDENKSPGLGVAGSDTDLVPDTEFVSDLGGKGQQKSNLSAAWQDRHEKPETSKNTAVSVESASQERETSPFPISVSSKVSADSHDVHTEVILSANQAEEIHTKMFSTLPDPVGQPETVEKDFSAATAVKSNSSETEECESQDTACEPVELQSSNITSATQSSPVAQTPIKGPDVEEITKEDKAALGEEKASSQGKGQNEIKAKNNEATEKQGVVNLTGSAKDRGLGSIKVSDLCESGVICSDITDRITPPFSSKCPEDFVSTPLAAPAQSKKPHEQVSLSKPHQDDIVENPTVAASQREGRSIEKAPVEQAPVDSQAADVSESPAPELTAREPDTDWIKALKEAASLSQSKPENTVGTSR